METLVREREGAIDLERSERAVRELLVAIGEDPDRETLVGTRGRGART